MAIEIKIMFTGVIAMFAFSLLDVYSDTIGKFHEKAVYICAAIVLLSTLAFIWRL